MGARGPLEQPGEDTLARREFARHVVEVLELAPDAMVIVDHRGHILATNSMIEQLLGYKSDELIDQPVEILLPERFAAAHPVHRADFFAAPRTRTMGGGMELAARAKSGAEIAVEVSLRPISTDSGNLVCAAIRDVGERRLAQEKLRSSEERLRFIVQNSPDVTYLQDLEFRYQWINNPPAPLTANDFIGVTDLERAANGTLDLETAQQLTAMKRTVLASGNKATQNFDVNTGRGPRFIELTIEPIRDTNGKIVWLAGYGRDRTDEYLSTQAREDARAAAEKASTRNARFLAIASHDLRQPVQTLALLLAASRRATDPILAAEMHQRIDDAMRSLTDMLDSLLNMTKIESAQLTPHVETVPLHELLASLQSEMTPLASQRGLTLDIDCGALGVKTDKALCRQIFQNLLGNAIKYTDRGGVSVICREKGDRIQVLVRDTGVGIPPNALNAVFGEFQQLGSNDGRARGGVGLGLWIVKRLADRLGIKVDVSSELGRGTTFTLDLPHAELPTTMLAAPASKLEHRPPSQQKQILLVEDDAAVRSSTILFLKVEGYGVIGVATLAEAYSAIEARAEGFDLIISDFHLAAGELGVDAIEFARRHYGRTLPAIVLSGDTSKAVAEFKSGSGTMFLDKPVDVDRLLRAIDKSLGLL